MNGLLQSSLTALLLGALALPALAQQDYPRRDRPQGDQQQRDQQMRDQQMRDRQQRDRRDQMRRPTRGRVTGEVVRTKRVDVRNSDRQHYVVLLKTQRNNRIVADLGPASQLGRAMPREGDRITVFGRLARVGDRRIVLGEHVRTGDRMVHLQVHGPRQDRGRFQTRSQPRREGERQAAFRPDQRRETDRRQSERRAALGVGMSGQYRGEGVQVTRVFRGSPADRAGIQPGDVILSIGGQSVSDPRDLLSMLARMNPDQQVSITISRDGQRRTLDAQLASRRQALGSEGEQRNPNRSSRDR